jgi:hypothetical protein
MWALCKRAFGSGRATYSLVINTFTNTFFVSHKSQPLQAMLLFQIFAITLALAPSLTSAAIFPKDTHVKMLDAKGFKRAMKKNVPHTCWPLAHA